MNRPQICKINGPLIDNGQHVHFEDILEKDRLNEDIDMQDGRILQLLHIMNSMDRTKYTENVDQAFINKIRDSEILIKMHMDGGANRSVTNDLRLLHDIQKIEPYAMKGAQNGPADIICQKKGILRLICQGRGVIEIKTYFSPHVAETIISPGDITEDPNNNFVSWDQHSNHQSKEGYIKFSSQEGLQSATVRTVMRSNRLWYVRQSLLDCINPTYNDAYDTPEPEPPLLRKLSAEVIHELWHQRLCHPGKTVTEHIHKTAEGVPNLTKSRNAFYKCRACDRSKIQSKPRTSVGPSTKRIANQSKLIPPVAPTMAGEHFFMDYGFVRGSEYKSKDDEGRIITSIDGYRAYLIIVDSFSGYMWVMLAKSKDPPLEYVRDFLQKNSNKKCQIKRVRTDQGGELWKSSKFKTMIHNSGFICEPTAAGDPAQNGRAEAPNKFLARMLRGMLYNASLSSKYWSYALTHAVYVKNRLPHSRHKFQMSPYEAWTGTKPNLSLLRVWGCRVTVKQPNPRSAKLDSIAREGIFLRYTATDKNIVYIDLESHQEKIGSHVVYDEANFVDGSVNPGGVALKHAGAPTSIKSKPTLVPTSQPVLSPPQQVAQHHQFQSTKSDSLQIMKTHPDAVLPYRATQGSAGLDITTFIDFSIKPKELKPIPTGLAISLPPSTCGKLMSRSGNTLHKNIEVKGGLIDADYTGEIQVLLYNFGDTLQSFKQGDKIAQLVIETIHMQSPSTFQSISLK